MPVDTSAPLRDIVQDYKGKNADELLGELGQVPFFMTEYNEEEGENPQIEALRAMAYEGEPWEVADNFRQQGNDCFKAKKYKDAVQFYTQALDQKTEKQEINTACLGNRAQCNLQLGNYRKCITDCTRVLDLDPANTKAWYRSAKAFLQLDKADEASACCERGLAADPQNQSLQDLRAQAQQRRARLAELAAREAARRDKADLEARTLELALSARKLTNKYTVTNKGNTNPGDLRSHLEDASDVNSTLYLPVLVLYPTALESDILTAVDETIQIAEILDQLFAEPPKWANPALYKPANIEVYAQTVSGGLAKVGHNTSLSKIFGNPSIVMVDNMARLYMVSKPEAPKWLSKWNKEAQLKQLRD